MANQIDKHSSFVPFLFALMCSVAFSGCGEKGGFAPRTLSSESSSQLASTGDEIVPVIPTADHSTATGGGASTGSLGICSALSLAGVVWPATLNVSDERALALALNISGSFEGDAGWANLTNNFDGQGISFGLLNQNVGAGSLQPLWIKMRDRHTAEMKSYFTAAHYASLAGMLAAWEKTGAFTSSLGLRAPASDDMLVPGEERLSHMDEEATDLVYLTSAGSSSVSWAVSTLYTDGGRTFQPTWKNELLRLAASPDFVSIQIETAQTLHAKAVQYMKTLKLVELRSYLFLFDINVQNGGLYQTDLDEYKSYFGSSTPTESQRLAKILDLRLRHVKSQYVTDVKTRKLAVINGSGTVHGSKRDFEKEYCFKRGVPYSTN